VQKNSDNIPWTFISASKIYPKIRPEILLSDTDSETWMRILNRIVNKIWMVGSWITLWYDTIWHDMIWYDVTHDLHWKTGRQAARPFNLAEKPKRTENISSENEMRETEMEVLLLRRISWESVNSNTLLRYSVGYFIQSHSTAILLEITKVRGCPKCPATFLSGSYTPNSRIRGSCLAPSTNQMSGWSDWSSTEKSSQYHLCQHLWHALS